MIISPQVCYGTYKGQAIHYRAKHALMELFISQTRRPFVLGLIIAFVTAFCVIGTLLFSYRYLNSPISAIQSGVIFEVEAGSSFSRVTGELAQKGYLDYPQLFVGLARLRDVADSIKSGEYELYTGITPRQLLEKMVIGDNVQYRITFIEGWTLNQVLEELKNSEKLTLDLNNANSSEIATALGLEQQSPEGMLFPDTYFYTKGTTDLEILKRASSRLDEVLSKAWNSRLGALPYENAYESLIMASIIEKESALGSERSTIASVFVRRLELGMRLQSDPTVIYGMGEDFQGDLRRADLEAENPYNTYDIDGLPPTPIALAGLQSVTASLNPAPSNYLYFVAKGDGSHYFSSTLEEHNDAVARYQKSAEAQ